MASVRQHRRTLFLLYAFSKRHFRHGQFTEDTAASYLLQNNCRYFIRPYPTCHFIIPTICQWRAWIIVDQRWIIGKTVKSDFCFWLTTLTQTFYHMLISLIIELNNNLRLQSISSNPLILRTQSMYQFLCVDANMPPPYLEIHWRNRLV